MSEHAPAATAATASPTFWGKHHFLFRRLHSLAGVVPVGVFVCMHLFTNFQILSGEFQHEVEFIHSLPALMFVEIGLWVSIGFHAALGLLYTFQSNAFGWPETQALKYKSSKRYFLQRVTGIFALLFILVHVATLRWRWDLFGWFTPFFVAGPNGEPLVAATTAKALQHHWLVVLFYVIGVYSVIYHWCNGLWTAAITWGLTISVQAQKRWGYVCAVLGVGLSIFAAGAIFGSYTYEISPQEEAAIQGAIERHKSGQPLIHESKHE